MLERDIVYAGYIIGQINAFDKEINGKGREGEKGNKN